MAVGDCPWQAEEVNDGTVEPSRIFQAPGPRSDRTLKRPFF